MVSGTDLFLGLFDNLAIFIIMVAVYGVLNSYFEESGLLRRQAAVGICFGLVAIGCMHVKIPVAEGVIVDQRNAVVALSGAFGGPLSALICAITAGAYRVHLGGAGIWGGVVGVSLAATSGIVFFWIRKKIDTIWKAALSALVATIVILPGFIFITNLKTGWTLLKAMSLPYGSAIFLGMFLVGLLLAHEETRHKAVVDLKRSEKRFRDLYERLVDVSFRTDEEGRVVAISPSCRSVLGYSPEEVIGRQLAAVHLHPARIDEFIAALRRDAQVENFETEIRKKDGTISWVSTNARRLTDAKGVFAGVEGVARNISRLKKAEEEKRQLEESLRQSQKMEAIGTLAGGIAHDFNNILGAVVGYTELVKDRLPEGSKERGYLEAVMAAADRATGLTKQILTFSRKSKPDRKPVEIHLVVAEAVNLLRRTIPETVKMNIDLDPRTGFISADATQIHQIVLNLCTNAYHALTLEEGKIDIRLQPEQVNHVAAGEHPHLQAGGYAVLTVRDTGEGMDSSTMARIFEPFFTTKKQGKGTGMGLSVVHGIVRDHGGAIGLESEPGVGSTFRVFIPLSDLESHEVPATQGEPRHGTERILLVDDDGELVKLGKAVLESLGYQVTATTSAMAAVATFRNTPGSFDLVITDQSMPEMPGDLLAKTAMRIRPDIPVIICTGHSGVIDAEKARAIGVRSFLLKPLDRKTLADTVRRVLDDAV